MNIPEGVRYTRDHEWVKIEGSSVRIGITDYAQHELGDVVFVDLKPVGTTVRKGDPAGTVESVKAVSDVYSPVSGTITEVNQDLESNPELVNEDCYGRGWMVVMEAASPGETDALMDAAAYGDYLSREAR